MQIAVIDIGSHVLPFDYHLLKALQHVGHSVSFFGSTTRYNIEFLQSLESDSDIDVYSFNISRSITTLTKALWDYLRLIYTLWNMRNNYDRIVLQFPVIWPLEFILFFFMRDKFIFTMHNAVPHNHQLKPYLPFRFMATIAKEIWFPSKATAHTFYNIYGSHYRLKGRIVQHGTMSVHPCIQPTPYIAPVSIEGLAYWGNIKPYKGIELFRDLVKAKQKSVTNLHIEIHGSWSKELHKIRDEIISYGLMLEDKFLTENELSALLSRNLIFVLPYKNASQSGALYTLLHHGRLFIASDTGDLGDFLRSYGLDNLILRDLTIESVDLCVNWLLNNIDETIKKLKTAQLEMSWSNSVKNIPILG